jgi:hypothetical protein
MGYISNDHILIHYIDQMFCTVQTRYHHTLGAYSHHFHTKLLFEITLYTLL